MIEQSKVVIQNTAPVQGIARCVFWSVLAERRWMQTTSLSVQCDSICRAIVERPGVINSPHFCCDFFSLRNHLKSFEKECTANRVWNVGRLVNFMKFFEFVRLLIAKRSLNNCLMICSSELVGRIRRPVKWPDSRRPRDKVKAVGSKTSNESPEPFK